MQGGAVGGVGGGRRSMQRGGGYGGGYGDGYGGGNALVASGVPQTPDHEATLDAMRRIRSETAAALRPQGPQQRAKPWPSR